MHQPTVLILPGWQGSGPLHWQMRWVALHRDVVVEQHDWMRPLRGDWLSRLDDVLSDLEKPSVLGGTQFRLHSSGGVGRCVGTVSQGEGGFVGGARRCGGG